MGVGSGWVRGAGGRPALVNLRAGQGRPGQGRTWEGWPELQGVGGGAGGGRGRMGQSLESGGKGRGQAVTVLGLWHEEDGGGALHSFGRGSG